VRFVRAAVGQVVSLFVSDWTQTVGIAVILVFGFAVARPWHALPVGFVIALLLAAHLVFTTVNEARRRSQR
jgi:hypothetical protein